MIYIPSGCVRQASKLTVVAILAMMMPVGQVTAVMATPAYLAGSSIEDGGTGRPAGLNLGSAEAEGKRAVPLASAISMLGTPAQGGLPLVSLPRSSSLDLAWEWRTTKSETALDRRWGRFILPVDSGALASLATAKYMVIWFEPQDAKSTLGGLSVSLSDGTKNAGKAVTMAGHLLTPMAPGKTVMVAVPVSEVLAGIDPMGVKTVVLSVAEPYEENAPMRWKVGGIVLSEVAVPGISRVGSADLGESVVVIWEARGGAEQVAVLSGGRTITTVPASDGQAILARRDVQQAIVLRPMAGKQLGQETSVGVPPSRTASAVTLRYAGPARSTPISRWLLGTNGQQIETAAGQGVGVVRWGGNHTSSYNWKDDSTNGSNDWYCMGGQHGATAWEKPEDSSWHKYFKRVLGDGMDLNVTIPISDWISKRIPEGQPRGSYPKSMYPEQQKFESTGTYGNGRTPDGKYIRMVDRNLTYRPNSVEFQREWIETIVKCFGTAEKGGVQFYGLDNEVNLWHSSHFDSKWEGIEGPEVVWRNVAYARMIKQVDPTAQVLGFAGWGQMGCAGSDRDYRRGRWSYLPKEMGDLERSEVRNGQDLLSWYLDQMRAAELAEGRRLIDIVSINWYPFLATVDPRTGKKVSLVDEKAGADQGYDPVITPLQFDALRYWWDPTYVNPDSWTYQGTNKAKFWDPYTPVLPKLHAVIAKHYPGTKLAITEYALGSEATMTGALLQIESIGIFMEQDLFSAQRWFGTRIDTWAYWGYALVGNWDGKRSGVHGNFRKVVSDNPLVTAYSTEDKTAGRRHVVIVNRSYDKPFQIKLPRESARTVSFSYLTEPAGKQVVRVPSSDILSGGDTVSVVLPPFSAVVCVLKD